MSETLVQREVTEDSVSDLRCDAQHHRKNRETMDEVACGVTAVAFMSTRCIRGESAAICQPLMDILQDAITNGGTCAYCGRAVRDCWVATPL